MPGRPAGPTARPADPPDRHDAGLQEASGAGKDFRRVLGRGSGRVPLADPSDDARGKLQAGQDAIYGIVYPLAIKLYAAGRPDKSAIRAFKSDAKAQLNSRFGDAVEVVLLKMLY